MVRGIVAIDSSHQSRYIWRDDHRKKTVLVNKAFRSLHPHRAGSSRTGWIGQIAVGPISKCRPIPGFKPTPGASAWLCVMVTRSASSCVFPSRYGRPCFDRSFGRDYHASLHPRRQVVHSNFHILCFCKSCQTTCLRDVSECPARLKNICIKRNSAVKVFTKDLKKASAFLLYVVPSVKSSVN